MDRGRRRITDVRFIRGAPDGIARCVEADRTQREHRCRGLSSRIQARPSRNLGLKMSREFALPILTLVFSWFASSCRLGGCFPDALALCFQERVPNTCELTFITKEGEDGRHQQHQLPQNELRSPPMIKHGYCRQRADEKETDLANTEQDMA